MASAVANRYLAGMNAPAASLQQSGPKQRKPDWIRVKAPVSEGYHATRRLMRDHDVKSRLVEFLGLKRG